MKRLISLFFIITMVFMLSRTTVCSQSVTPFVIASSGGYFVSSNAQLSWTLGEVVISTFSAGNSILNQGFQQNTYIITSVNEISDNLIITKVYPNPTSNFIRIEWQSTDPTDILINFSNNQGVCLMEKKVSSSENQTEIDISNFPNSIYILTISSVSGKILKTFKIVKI